MTDVMIRVLVTLLIAALLWAQARASRQQPHRRRGFELAAAALLALAAFNGTVAAEGQLGPLQIVIGLAGMALLIGAVVSIALSYRAGEMRGQRDQIAAAAQEYRDQHSKKRR